jgi:cytochrome c oxidase subunit 2
MTHQGTFRRCVNAALIVAVAALSIGSACAADMPSNPEKYLGMPWLPEGVSTYAKSIDDLWNGIFYLTGVVFVVTEALLLVFVLKFRARAGAKSVYTHGNHTLEMAWTITPAIILGAIAILQKSTWDEIKKPEYFPKGKDVVHIQTFAKQFEWNFRYAGSDAKWGNDDDIVMTNHLVVPVNRPIVMEQTSLDVIHSFFLPNMRLKQDVVPGMQIQVWFQPMKTTLEMRKTRGDYVKPKELMSTPNEVVQPESKAVLPTTTASWNYEVVCAELCGIQHGEMRGYLEVLDQETYDKWYAQASKEAADNEQPEIWKFWPVAKGKEETGDRDFDVVKKMYHAEKVKEKKEHAKAHEEAKE